MLAVAVLSFVLMCIERASLENNCIYPEKVGNQADYYWRDYFGIVPKDAVPGGYAADGNRTYVGQSSDIKRIGIFPGIIYAEQKEIVICPGEKFVDATYVKILCSNPYNNFEWIKTTADESHLLTDYHLIIGGSEYARVWHVGRVNFENEVRLGRVYDSKAPHKGLWICSSKAGHHMNFLSFEILVVAR